MIAALIVYSDSFCDTSWLYHRSFFGNFACYEIFFGGTTLLLPALSTYALLTRWRFKYNLRPSSISRIVHIVSIDDDIFLLLGLAPGVQRLAQLLLGPIYGSFEKLKTGWIAWWVSMPLAVSGVVAYFWHRAAPLHAKIDYLSRYIALPFRYRRDFCSDPHLPEDDSVRHRLWLGHSGLVG